MPATSSFAFNVNTPVAAPTSVPVKSARNRQCGGKASLFDANDDFDTIPLAERRRRKRCHVKEPITPDNVDFCLAGSSVVDPLLHLEDLPPLPSSPTLATSKVASQDPSEPSSEEVTVEVLAEGYAPWASVQPHSPPLPKTINQKDFPAINISAYSMAVESESPPGSSPQSNYRNNNNISTESEIPPVSSPAIVSYHDKDSHDKHNDIDLGSDTPPVSSSANYGTSHLEPISPVPHTEAGAVIDSDESSNSPESLCDTRALQLMFPTLSVFHFLENEF